MPGSRRGDVRVAGVDVDLLQRRCRRVGRSPPPVPSWSRSAARRRPARAAAERVVLLDGVEQRDVEAVGHRVRRSRGSRSARYGPSLAITPGSLIQSIAWNVGRPLDEQPGVEHEPVDVDVRVRAGCGRGRSRRRRRRSAPRIQSDDVGRASHRRRAVGDRVDHRQVGEQAIDRVVVVRVVRVRLADAEVQVVVAQRTEQEPVARGQPVGDERVRLAVGADIVVEQGEQLPRRLGVVGALRAADGDVTAVVVVVTDAAPAEQHPQRTLLPAGAVWLDDDEREGAVATAPVGVVAICRHGGALAVEGDRIRVDGDDVIRRRSRAAAGRSPR